MGPKVREHMTDRPRCVTPETPVSEAAELMASEDVGSLPILDGDELIGVSLIETSSSERSRSGRTRRGCQYARSRALSLSPLGLRRISRRR